MHEYFRPIWHIFKIYCPNVPCGWHLRKTNTFPWACAEARWGCCHTPHSLPSVHMYSLCTSGGRYIFLGQTWTLPLPSPVRQQDLCESFSPAFLALTWQLLTGCLLPGAHTLLLQAAPCPGRCCPLGRTSLFPDGWRAPSCQRLVCVPCIHQRKIFHCNCQVQHWVWHKQPRFPLTITTPVWCSADPFLHSLTYRHSRQAQVCED